MLPRGVSTVCSCRLWSTASIPATTWLTLATLRKWRTLGASDSVRPLRLPIISKLCRPNYLTLLDYKASMIYSDLSRSKQIPTLPSLKALLVLKQEIYYIPASRTPTQDIISVYHSSRPISVPMADPNSTIDTSQPRCGG